MMICFLVFTVSRLLIPCLLVPNIFYTIAVGEYQFLYLMIKVQRELFFCALKLQKTKLRETVLQSVVKPSCVKHLYSFVTMVMIKNSADTGVGFI